MTKIAIMQRLREMVDQLETVPEAWFEEGVCPLLKVTLVRQSGRDCPEPSATEFTQAASETLRRRWRDTLRSPVFWRAFFRGIGLWSESPSVRGGLGVLLTMLLVLIAAPIVIRAVVWWWSLWLP